MGTPKGVSGFERRCLGLAGGLGVKTGAGGKGHRGGRRGATKGLTGLRWRELYRGQVETHRRSKLHLQWAQALEEKEGR